MPAHQRATKRQLLPTSREEIQFAYDHGLMAWNPTAAGYDAIQIVMADKSVAESLKSLIESEYGQIDNLVVRKSSIQGMRWVVQIPLQRAANIGILPTQLDIANIASQLPRTAKDDPLAIKGPRRL